VLLDIQMKESTQMKRMVLKGGYRRLEKTMFQSKSLCQKHQQLMNVILYELDLNR
jgi:hypothetical protein